MEHIVYGCDGFRQKATCSGQQVLSHYVGKSGVSVPNNKTVTKERAECTVKVLKGAITSPRFGHEDTAVSEEGH